MATIHQPSLKKLVSESVKLLYYVLWLGSPILAASGVVTSHMIVVLGLPPQRTPDRTLDKDLPNGHINVC